jgi:hypothetical protein
MQALLSRKATATNSIDPLDPDIRRAFSDLIRVAAPWIRRFPTARKLDDEAGQFLTRSEQYDDASSIVTAAEEAAIITTADAKLMRGIIYAAKRGGFQGHKAGARGVWSSKNLASAIALVLSFEAGMIGNEAAGNSPIARKGAEFYLRAEREVLRLFEDAPDDVRQALIAMIDDLRKNGPYLPANLPERPRELPIQDRRRRGDR